MSKKLAIGLAAMMALSSCEVVKGLRSGLSADKGEEAAASGPPGRLTRAAVDESNAALISLYHRADDQYPVYYYALADNANTGSYGKDGLIVLTLRGGLIVSQYVAGNDLLGVKVNADDPIQFAKPLASWPSQISRVYQLPGEGLEGDLRRVQCDYEFGEDSELVIVEWAHAVSHIFERCAGDESFTNEYWVDAEGLVWRSIQWVGNNPMPMLLDVIEPLD